MTAEIIYIPPEIESQVPETIKGQANLLANGPGVTKVEVIQTKYNPSTGEIEYKVQEYHQINPFITPKS